MRTHLLRVVTGCLAGVGVLGCGHDHGGGDILGDLVLLDDASDEVAAEIAEKVDRDGALVDNTRAAALVAPAAGATVPRATPVTIDWDLPSSAGRRPRHGQNTGTFVWVRLEAPGLAEPIDVVAIGTTSFTPDAARWRSLVDATGPVTATITTAVVDRGVIQAGPFRPSEASRRFTID